MIVELVQPRRTETGRVGSPQAEVAGGIHECYLGREVPVEGLMVGQTQPCGGGEISEQSHLVLAVCRQRVDSAVDIARCGHKPVFAPLCSKDSGGIAHQSQDGLELCVQGALPLALHIVAHSIVLGLDIIEFAISEVVGCEIGLQRV